MNMCNNCCDNTSYQPNPSMTTYPLACCQTAPREPLCKQQPRDCSMNSLVNFFYNQVPVSQQYPSANRRTVVKIQKKCLNSKLGSVAKPPKNRDEKSPLPPSDGTCRNSFDERASTKKRSVPSKQLALSSGEACQVFDSSSRNTMKSKRVTQSPELSSEEMCEAIKPRKSSKKSQVATTSECKEWSDDDACDGSFKSARKTKVNASDCDSQYYDRSCEESKSFSDCGDVKSGKSFKSKANLMNSKEKNCSNYMYDNPELRQSKAKKSCADSCVELDDAIGSDMEVWLFQCPKDFDPKQVMNCELGKGGRSQGIECSADRFCTKKTLAVIAPEKAAEYEMFCDNIKLLKPVGKIVVCESNGFTKISSQSQDFDYDCSSDKINSSESENDSEVDECASSEPEEESCKPASPPKGKKSKKSSIDQRHISETEEPCKQPLAGKKIKKKVNDQRFTIETTLTVEKCANDRKKSMGASPNLKSQYLPIDPPEPEPSMKKKKKTTKDC